MPKVALPLALSIALTLSGAALSSSRADTITLKSGEKYEGTIVSQNETEVVVLVQVSGGITDEQTFKRDDIAELLATSADELEIRKLTRYEVGAHSKTPASYNLGIAAYENFQKRFPESGHKQFVTNQIQSLKDERARVARKEVKINNRWYTQAEIKEEQYQIAAQRLLQIMNDQAAKGDIVGALNSFDKLESDHPGSAAYPQAVLAAVNLVKRLQAEIVRAVPIAKQQQQKFDENIEHTLEPEKSRMIAAQRSAIARSEASFTQSSAKWKPFFAAMDQSVTALNTTIGAESPRLAAIDTEPMIKSLKLTDEGREALSADKKDVAAAKFNEALAIWKANEAATRLSAGLTAAAEGEAKEGETPAEEGKAAEAPKATGEGAETEQRAAEAEKPEGQG